MTKARNHAVETSSIGDSRESTGSGYPIDPGELLREGVPDGCGGLVIDEERQLIIGADRRCEEIFGCAAGQLPGESPLRFHVSKGSFRVLTAIARNARRTGRDRLTVDYWLLRGDGTPFVAEVTVRRMVLGDEARAVLVYFIRDRYTT